eukprot:TRINITY_DN29158_c0_g1_i2.p1 TRINITY_DN29158_c0_g1~~TRINITY_DN29158_c0_g1_i2.p1  ORF type:complete len:472 (+),score=156.89 TRINITY_DN29158_c0_g1_i2:137-1552(+)
MEQETSPSTNLKQNSCAAKIASSRYFENLTLLIISINAIWIGVDLENNDAAIWLEAHPVFAIMDNLFCSFFSFEVIVRLMAFESKLLAFKDKSFSFDVFLVVLMIVETWGLAIYASLSSGSSSGGLRQLSILRLLRMLRLTRMGRLMRYMPELLTLAKGLLKAMRAVATTFLFLLGIIWVFAIIFHIQYGHTKGDLAAEYFGRIGVSMVTLFVNGTLLDELTSVGYLLVEDSIIMTVVFFIFVLLSSLTVLNMLIGILSDVVGQTAGEEKEILAVAEAEAILRQVFDETDINGNGKLSGREFERLLLDPNSPAAKALLGLGIPADRLKELARQVFHIEDSALPGGEDSVRHIKSFRNAAPEVKELDFRGFMQEVLRVRQSEFVSVRDFTTMRRAATALSKTTDRELLRTQSDLKRLAKSTSTELKKQASKDLREAKEGGTPMAAPTAKLRKLEMVPTSILLEQLAMRLDMA